MVSERSFTTFEFQKPDEDTCGAVSIVNILKNLEIEASLQSILEKLAISPMDKTHAPQLAVCLNQFHLDIVVVSSNPFVTPADWKGLSSALNFLKRNKAPLLQLKLAEKWHF